LSQMQTRRRTHEVSFFGYGYKVAHMAQFHSASYPKSMN
jgi:hypothetical protein